MLHIAIETAPQSTELQAVKRLADVRYNSSAEDKPLNGGYVWSSTVLTWNRARQLVVLVIGGTMLVVGIALLVLPGPAMVVIPVALAVLGTEFVWARRLLHRVKDGAVRIAESARRGSTVPRSNAPPNG